MEKQKSSKPLKPSDKGKTSSDKKLRQPANPKRKKAEEEVERFASFPKLNPNPVLEVDSSGKITFHNDAAVAVLKKFNLSEDVSVFLPEDIQEILAGLKQKREGQYNRELIMKGKVFEETIYLVPQFNTLRLYAVDITERKRAETALQVSESKYRSLFANMISGFAYHQIVLNRNGKPVDYIFLEINNAFEKLTGLKRENIIGKMATEVIPGIENDPAGWIGMYGNVAITGKQIRFENYSEALKKWYSVSAYSSQKGYFVTVFDDITTRKREEEELRRLNRTLKALGKSSKAMMRAKNEAEYLNDVCRIIVEDCGHAMVWIGFAEDDDAKTVRPVAYAGFDEGYIKTLKITWADTERGRGPTGTAIRTGQPSICRNMCTDPLFKPWREEAIKRGYASSVVVPLMDGGKAIGAINIYAREPDPFTEDEVTLLSELAGDLSYGISSIRLKVAHDQTQEAIRQSEERYRSLVEVSPDAVFVNRDNRIVFANPAALQLFGAAGAEQVLGKSPFEMFEPGYHSIMRKRIETLLEGESVPLIEGRIVRLDGTRRDVEVAATPFNASAGRAIQVILRDITERKRTEEALRESREDLNRAQAVAHTGSWRLDVRKNELLWSDENWRIFGVPKGTALTYETFLSTIHPDDREYVDKQWSAALQGEPYDIEHRIIVDGQVKWVREKAELEFDKDGNLKGGFGATQDITEMKQVERDLQTLMEELKRSNSDLEQFAYAASHDLQEPLRVVAGFVSLLEKKYKEKLDDKAHEYIEYSVDGVKRMQVLIRDLLAYSQVGTKGKTFKPTICSVALEQAIYNLRTAIEESGAEITYDSLPTVSADTSQLIRLFQNLIGNAIKFRGEERLKIHIAAEQKGNEWIFSVRDNGIGIDPKFFSRIFVVFQRLHTREEYEGTGIGLAVCKKIVERHGGHIWVESEPGKGTTFYFTMPVMQ